MQLVDWLNNTMKSMSRSQAAAFLQLIQDRQIYVQVKQAGKVRSSYEKPLQDPNASTMVNTASPMLPKGKPGSYPNRKIRLEGVEETDDVTVTSGEALIHNSFGEIPFLGHELHLSGSKAVPK